MEEPASGINLPPLEWGTGRVQIECIFLGKTHRFEHVGSFARIGRDPRCEWCIPDLPAPVCVYLQFTRNYVVVLELVDTDPTSMCEPVYALPGATVWLQPNARITVESIEPSEPKLENFSWENFNVDDVKVFPNTLIARSGYYSSSSQSTHLRLQYALSVLGSSPSCQLRPEHKHIGRYQAVIFRGEHQGESCRVIDLFSEHTTLIDNQHANGQALEVGSQLKIANLTFEAVRLLYSASRPSQIVEVRNQFSTLPLSSKQESSPLRGQTRTPEPPTVTSESLAKQGTSVVDLQTMKDRLARAIGFDTGASHTRRVHFPIDQEAKKPIEHTSESTLEPRIADGLDRVAKSQDRLTTELERIATRLQEVEESIEHLPEILDNNSQQLVESIESLKKLIQQAAKTSSDPGHETKPTQSNPTTVAKPIPIAHKTTLNAPANTTKNKRADAIKADATTKVDKTYAKQQSKSELAATKRNKTPSQQERKNGQAINYWGKDQIRLWLERVTTSLAGWIPDSSNRRREIAERSEQSDPLNLGSQATAKRTRLQHHNDESNRLSASESEDETLVLGSLMGLRYRDAKKTFLRWSLFAIILLITAMVGGPLIWNQIPEGWRELIWQKITLTPAPEEPQYIPSYESRPTNPPNPSPSREPAFSSDSDPLPSTQP